jgi:hypothetical protein
LAKFGKGDWRSISRNFVISRTPTQVASHAQKYFIRLNSLNKKDKRRSSIHDITSVNNAKNNGGGKNNGNNNNGVVETGNSNNDLIMMAAAAVQPMGVLAPGPQGMGPGGVAGQPQQGGYYASSNGMLSQVGYVQTPGGMLSFAPQL